MELLWSAPYLLRLLLSLGCILVFQRLTGSLAVAMLSGVLFLALWTGHGLDSAIDVVSERVVSLDMLLLVLVIAGVIWLSSLMSASGIMKDLVVCLKSRLNRRAMLAALPAVVGLLPMPAGALFSAPLVDDADDEKLISPARKTRINYWFRHIWEFWWPLYPGVLLAVDMSGLGVFTFVGLLFPLFLAAIASGYFFLLRDVPNGESVPRGADDKAFLPLVLPILTVIAVYGALLALAPALARVNKYAPMAVGVVCGLFVLQRQRPATLGTWMKVALSRRTAGLLLIIVLARVYGAFVEARLADGSFLMDRIRGELFLYGIPAVLLVVIIPFVAGLTTGITIGYIGASFPLVLSLAGAGGGIGEFYFTIILGYVCGFLGMMLSPIHVCLIVSNEYFKTSLMDSLAGLFRPVMLTLGLAICYSLLWLAVG